MWLTNYQYKESTRIFKNIMLILFTLLLYVHADLFVAFKNDIPGYIDVYSVLNDTTCTLNQTVNKLCYDRTYDFHTDNMQVRYDTTTFQYVVKVNEDSNKYLVYNPVNALPNTNELQHFTNTVYNINNTNIAFVSTVTDTYEVKNYDDILLFMITKQLQVQCIHSNITYDSFYFIKIYNDKYISINIPLAHILTYFDQTYNGSCPEPEYSAVIFYIFFSLFVFLLICVFILVGITCKCRKSIHQ